MTDPKATLYCIPHSHWEGAVFQTRAQYLEIGLPHILQAMRLLRKYPHYRYTLDQVCYVAPFLERYPEEAADFRRFVEEGRLAIVGGTDVMLDVNMPGGESFVRQVLYGKGYFRRTLGVEVNVGWQLDTFGHHAQMPQLLRLSGLNSHWSQRGAPSKETPTEFAWEGIDGTRVPFFWLPLTYGLLYYTPKTLPEFTEFMKDAYERLGQYSRSADRVGLTAYDVVPPEAHLPVMVEEFNQQPDQPFRLQLAAPAEYEAAVAERGDLPVVAGDLNPIFQGTYSSRIEVKQRTRELETLLTGAEKLGALLRLRGEETDDELLMSAWEPMLFNQAHDLMSGVMTDQVWEDSLRGYDFAQRIGEEQSWARLRMLVEQIDTRGEGTPLVVFNLLGGERTDVVETSVGFGEAGSHGLKLVGPQGEEIPVQILETKRYEDDSLLQVRLAFVAREVPALGYAVYHVIPQAEAGPQVEPATEALLENEFYRVQLDPGSGAITGLTVKEGNWEALSGPGNVVAMEEDKGDFWELYHTLDGATLINVTWRHEPPQPGQAIFSTEQTEEAGQATCGPVFSEFTVTHPFSEQGRFQTRVRLYAGLRRIDIRTKILNQDSYVRYRALFPTTIPEGKSVQEIPFGAINRPDGIEFPAQNWVDWGDGTRGVALLNRGLPGNNVAGGTMMLSLMRCTSIVAYGFGGGYGPGMGSESGLELGKELTFDYALVPHTGDWSQAGVYRDGLELNHPLIACTTAPHAGSLPARWGLLSISHPNLMVSSLKVSDSGALVLRVYEAAGMEVDEATITFVQPLLEAEELNLVEDTLHPLEVEEGRLRLALRPFEIKTLGLRFGGNVDEESEDWLP